MTVIVLFAVLLVTVSAYSGRVYEAAEGFKAPDLKVENQRSCLRLADMKGRYVLLNFWASSDAASRIRAAHYDALAAAGADGEQFCLVSVNLDRSERLFNEIVRLDNLNATTQFHVSPAEAAALRSGYNLRDGFKSFLIDPEGRIVEMNPAASTVKAIAGL